MREFPTTRERAIQTEKTWSVDQVLYEVFGQNQAETVENASQTETTYRATGIQATPDLRTMGAQTTPDNRTRETQTLPPDQRTVSTQVELTTTIWNWTAGPSGLTDGAGASKGRGRGLRPIRPSELVSSRPRGFTPPRPHLRCLKRHPRHRWREGGHPHGQPDEVQARADRSGDLQRGELDPHAVGRLGAPPKNEETIVDRPRERTGKEHPTGGSPVDRRRHWCRPGDQPYAGIAAPPITGIWIAHTHGTIRIVTVAAGVE